MTNDLKEIAQKCLLSAEDNTLNFPQIVGILIEAGFEGYMIDYRRATATYYLENGESFTLETSKIDEPMAEEFDAKTVKSAILEAQQGAEDYTYKGFCKKTIAAGCAGYLVSFLGKRVLYYGRDAEIHIEYFPQ